MKRVIRLGDPTSHGGAVLSATATTSMFGKQVALLGDKVSCPQKGHSNCVIIEGDPSWDIGGKPVALEGHKVSCGAVLISTMPQVERSYEGNGAVIAGSVATGLAKNSFRASTQNDAREQYDEQVHLLSPLIDGVPFFIQKPDGSTVSGRTGQNGLLDRIPSQELSEYTVYWGDEALAKTHGIEQ